MSIFTMGGPPDTYAINPGFELGEDIRTEARERQDEAWKEAVKDGRAHISHREAASKHSLRLTEAIRNFHQIEAMVDLHLNQVSYINKITQYQVISIIDFILPGQGILVLESLKRRGLYISTTKSKSMYTKESKVQIQHDSVTKDQTEIDAEPKANTFFRLCVRKRPLL